MKKYKNFLILFFNKLNLLAQYLVFMGEYIGLIYDMRPA